MKNLVKRHIRREALESFLIDLKKAIRGQEKYPATISIVAQDMIENSEKFTHPEGDVWEKWEVKVLSKNVAYKSVRSYVRGILGGSYLISEGVTFSEIFAQFGQVGEKELKTLIRYYRENYPISDDGDIKVSLRDWRGDVVHLGGFTPQKIKKNKAFLKDAYFIKSGNLFRSYSDFKNRLRSIWDDEYREYYTEEI